MVTFETRHLKLDRYIVLLLLAVVVGCAETVVDPDTAKVTGGDIADTIPQLDLQKAVVKAGMLGGAGGNTVVESFIRFEHRVRYTVDTLDDGSPIRLKNVKLESDLDDDDDFEDMDNSNPFHPLREMELEIPGIEIRPNGTGQVPLVGRTGGNIQGRAALRLRMARTDESAEIWIREDSTLGDAGSVQVVSVNPRDRVINLSVYARLHHEAADRLPHTIILEMLLELPY